MYYISTEWKITPHLTSAIKDNTDCVLELFLPFFPLSTVYVQVSTKGPCFYHLSSLPGLFSINHILHPESTEVAFTLEGERIKQLNVFCLLTVLYNSYMQKRTIASPSNFQLFWNNKRWKDVWGSWTHSYTTCTFTLDLNSVEKEVGNEYIPWNTEVKRKLWFYFFLSFHTNYPYFW